MERLNEMGFVEQAEAAVVHTQCESVENAVAFILTNIDCIYHRFGVVDHNSKSALNGPSNDRETRLCTVCGCAFDEHLIDENGEKIGIGLLDEENYNHFDDEYSVSAHVDLCANEQMNHENEQIKSQKIKAVIERSESKMESSILKHDGPTDQCLICFDEKPISHFSETECGHSNYCNECLTHHYKVKTKDGDVLKVKCIDPNCDREIKEDEIMKFLTDDALKEKFRKFKRQKLLMLNENARFCPTANCEGYMIGSRLKPKLECPECKTKICFNCSKPWHGYFTKCSSAQDTDHEMTEKFYAWESNKDVKKCPKCKMRIEKNAGCNHMTCVSCKYEFCWICRGKYSSNHFAEWNVVFGCPGAQYNGRGCSIQSCPTCMPIWLRRMLIIILCLLLMPIVLVFGCLAACVYGCLVCVVGVLGSVCR